MTDPLDVSGAWSGIYSYPRGSPPNGFTVALTESAGAVTGEVVEPPPSAHPAYGREARAFVDGRRSSAALAFVKHYDAAHRAGTPVAYQGTLSADGDEITGRWEIAGHWGGTFIMVRQSRRGASVEQRTGEVVG